MKRIDLAQLESLCRDVVRQLDALKSTEARAVSAELEYRTHRLALVEGGLPTTVEDVSALEADLAALDAVIARCVRQRRQLGPSQSKAAADQLRHELHVQWTLATELRHIINQQLSATRAAGEAQSQLVEQMEKARAVLLASPTAPAAGTGNPKPKRTTKRKSTDSE